MGLFSEYMLNATSQRVFSVIGHVLFLVISILSACSVGWWLMAGAGLF
jgi:DMSO/TMAO reductase YedYZ heme-binding membrane subunit